MADSSGGTSRGDNNHYQRKSEKNNYLARVPTLSGDSTEFECWKSKMYTRVIDLDDKL